MIGYGEILQQARQLKGVDISKIAVETNITVRYLEALEAEHKDVFPGEPYLLGFLRNYAEYLGLNADDVISVYKKIELQQSVVTDELFVRKRKIPYIPIAIASVACIGILIGIFSFINHQKQKQIEESRLAAIAEAPAVYTLSDVPLEVTLRGNDIIQVATQADEMTELKVVTTSSFLSLQTPIGVLIVDQGEEIGLDIDGVPGSELTVFVSRLPKDDSSEGVAVRMLLTNAPAKLDKAITTADSEIQALISSGATEKISMFEGYTAYPFTLQVAFRGPTMFRYESDNNDYIENFFVEGDELLVQANNGIRVWMSNENAAKMEIIGGGETVDLEAGLPGKVSVQDIRWRRNEEGQYRLSVYNLE